MQASSTNAFFISAVMHGGAVALLLFSTYACQQQLKQPPKIFELVAGGGDNYTATEAPALGNPGGIKISIPEAPAPARAQSAQSEPTPPPEPVIAKAPPEKSPATAAPPKDAPVLPNISRQIKNKLVRADAKAKAEVKKEREAEQKRLTKEEFDRMNRNKATIQPRAGTGTKISRIDAEGIRNGVVGGSTANKTGGAGGKALTREEGDAIDGYIALLVQKIKNELDERPGVGAGLVVEVEMRILRDGSIIDIRIVKSSGSRDFDSAAREALATLRMPARPAGLSEYQRFPILGIGDE